MLFGSQNVEPINCLLGSLSLCIAPHSGPAIKLQGQPTGRQFEGMWFLLNDVFLHTIFGGLQVRGVWMMDISPSCSSVLESKKLIISY